MKFYFCNLNTLDYNESLIYQKKAFDLCLIEKIAGCIFFVEHHNTITLGKNSSTEYILLSKDNMNKLGFKLYKTDRGGDVTMHMPQQLVVYPILNLKKIKIGVKDYVRKLEIIIIKTLAKYDIKAEVHAKHPGVWTKNKKICSIGIRVKKYISLHGLALNYNNNLSLFNHIVPCGIANKAMTSMNRELKTSIDKFQLISKIMLQFKQELLFVEGKVIKPNFFIS